MCYGRFNANLIFLFNNKTEKYERYDLSIEVVGSAAQSFREGEATAESPEKGHAFLRLRLGRRLALSCHFQ